MWSFASKECKCELREHDHVVEDIAWAPDSASTHVNEAAAIEVRWRLFNVAICRHKTTKHLNSIYE